MNPPRRRSSELIVRQVSDETLIYDERNDQAHCLNSSAAMVWQQCDGVASPEEIAAHLNRELGIPPDVDVVRLAIGKLDRAQLLEPRDEREKTKDISRRELARRLGLAAGAAIVLPLVSSIVAPTPLMAASCIKRGKACSGNIPCCGNLDCENNRCQ